MTNEEIINLFDYSNITLGELSIRSGRSIKELKAILLDC